MFLDGSGKVAGIHDRETFQPPTFFLIPVNDGVSSQDRRDDRIPRRFFSRKMPGHLRQSDGRLWHRGDHAFPDITNKLVDRTAAVCCSSREETQPGPSSFSIRLRDARAGRACWWTPSRAAVSGGVTASSSCGTSFSTSSVGSRTGDFLALCARTASTSPLSASNGRLRNGGTKCFSSKRFASDFVRLPRTFL